MGRAAPVSFGTERVREGHAEQNKNQRTRVYTHFRASNRSCICLFFVRKADFVADVPVSRHLAVGKWKIFAVRKQQGNGQAGYAGLPWKRSRMIENYGGVQHTWLVLQV